jgi:uncharacterized protein involved in exopolysaccharide biosynthesis
MEVTKTFDAPAESKLHFLDYWRIIRVRKTVILAVFLLVVITTAVVTFILPPTWASTARISVQKDATDIQSVSGAPIYTPFDPIGCRPSLKNSVQVNPLPGYYQSRPEPEVG